MRLQELMALATFIELYHTVLDEQLTISRNNPCLVSALCLGLALFIPALFIYAQKPAAKPQPPISWSQGKLQYAPDSLGNRVPDFSYCGYKAGEESIPIISRGVLVPLIAS